MSKNATFAANIPGVKVEVARGVARTYFKTCLRVRDTFSLRKTRGVEVLNPPLKKRDLGGFQEVIKIPPAPLFHRGVVLPHPEEAPPADAV